MNNIIPFDIITPSNKINISISDLLSFVQNSNGDEFIVDFNGNEFYEDKNYINRYYIDFNRIIDRLQPDSYKLYMYGLAPVADLFTIEEISNDRYEIKLKISERYKSVINKELGFYKNKFIIATDYGMYKIINSYADNDFLYVKLIEKISNEQIKDDPSQLYEELFEPFVINFDVKTEEFFNKLQNLDFLSGSNSPYSNDSVYGEYNYEQLISTGTFSESIERDFYKKSKNRPLNIDYSDFSNFIYFASANDVLTTAYNKVVNFINYESQKNTVTGSNLKSLYNLYQDKQFELMDDFSPFENYLFNDSWPRISTNITGGLYHYTSSNVVNWYSGMIDSASNYDNTNDAQLWMKIPNYYFENDENNVFYNFIHSLACNYDSIKCYIDQFINFVNINYDGINIPPNELLWILSNYLGFDLKDGNSLKSLTQYILGYDITGSLNTNELRNVTYEIWKRLLNNIPYIYKSKGTNESIRSILNSYGIPAGLININEYTVNSKYESASYETYYKPIKSTKYLELQGTSLSVSSIANWAGSGSDNLGDRTFEIHMKFPYSSITGSQNYYLITSSTGKLSLEISPSSQSNEIFGVNLYYSGNKIGPTVSASIGNNKFTYYAFGYKRSDATNPNTSQSFLKVIQYDNNILTFNTGFYLVNGPHGACIAPVSTSAIRFGATSNDNNIVSKSLMEFRLWNRALTENEMLNHAYDFKSIALDNAFTNNVWNYNDLIARFKFDDNVDLSTNSLKDTAINPQSITITDIGFPTNVIQTSSLSYWKPLIKNTKTFVPSPIGKRRDNKIRIISGSIESASITYDLPLIEALWSPTDVIDNDIIENIGNMDFNDIMGEPTDYFSGSYSTIQKYTNAYFNKFIGAYNFNKFIRLIDTIDKSIKNSIQQMVPARAKLNYGLLISSHLLERNKHKYENIVSTEMHRPSGSISINNYIVLKQTSFNDNIVKIDSSEVISVKSQSNAIQTNFDYGILSSSGNIKSQNVNYVYKDMRHSFYLGSNNMELDGIINAPWTSSITYGEVIWVK